MIQVRDTHGSPDNLNTVPSYQLASHYDLSVVAASRVTREPLSVQRIASPFYTFIYVISGSGTYVCRGTEFPMSPGILFAAMPGAEQSWCVGPEGMMDTYFLGFVGRKADGILGEVGVTPDHPFIRVQSYAASVIATMETIVSVFGSDADPCSEWRTRGLLWDLISLLPLDKTDHPGVRQRIRSDIVKEALSLIETDFRSNLSLEVMSRRICVSKSHLSKVFREQTGESPCRALIRMRMTVAKFLLSESDLSISEIASRIGIDDLSRMSRLFRRHTGMSPSQFRLENAHNQPRITYDE